MGVEITPERLRPGPIDEGDAPRTEALCSEIALSRWLARAPRFYPPGEARRIIPLCRASEDRGSSGAAIRA